MKMDLNIIKNIRSIVNVHKSFVCKYIKELEQNLMIICYDQTWLTT